MDVLNPQFAFEWLRAVSSVALKDLSMAQPDAEDEKARFFSQLHQLDRINDDDEDEDEGFHAVENFLANLKSQPGSNASTTRGTDESFVSSRRKQGSSRMAPTLSREGHNVPKYKSTSIVPPKESSGHRHDRFSRSLSFPEKLNPSKTKGASPLHLPYPPTLQKTSSAPPLLSASSDMSSRKRSKKGTVQLVPENRRIFKDLTFCIDNLIPL